MTEIFQYDTSNKKCAWSTFLSSKVAKMELIGAFI
jgi:hypothetical protein